MRRLWTPLVSAVMICGAVILFAWQWRAEGRVQWTTIGTGLELRTLHASPVGGVPAAVFALRTSPSRLHVVAGEPRTATSWRRGESARAAVNGGFFDTASRSLGLRVSRGRSLTRLRRTYWGVFFVRAGKARIVSSRDFVAQPQIREAVQCGPRLVVNGQVTQLKPQWARRTGIGVQRDGRVIIAVADGSLSFQEWAALWAAPRGLNCPNALNLDGGTSTQLSLKATGRVLEISGGRSVPDAVVIE